MRFAARVATRVFCVSDEPARVRDARTTRAAVGHLDGHHDMTGPRAPHRAARLPRSLSRFWAAAPEPAPHRPHGVSPPAPSARPAPAAAVLGCRATRAFRREALHAVDTAARRTLADPPPPLRLSVLRRWAPAVVRALNRLPRLVPPAARGPVPRQARVCLPLGTARAARRHTAQMSAHHAVALVNLKCVPKPAKPVWRLITDARHANRVVLPTRHRLSARAPRLDSVASFLRHSRFASASDFEAWFHAHPIGHELRRLFFVPRWRRALKVLPMGYVRASDIAAASTAAIADLPFGRGVRVPLTPGRVRAGVLANADNILVAGPSAASVRARVARVERRSALVGARFSQPFAPPARRVVYYGVEWHLGRHPTRGLPAAAAVEQRQRLLQFARSRGPQSSHAWLAALGTASWVGAVAAVDVTARYPLIQGARVAAYRGSAVPGRPARLAALRHAEAALRRVPLAAPASFAGYRIPLSALPHRAHLFISDAASPGACAVVHCPPGRTPRLVHWRPVPASEPAVVAELSGIHAAACCARELRVRPVFVSDALAAVHMVRRGVSRNPRHMAQVADIRACARVFDLLWVPTGLMAEYGADGPSRAASRARATRLARSAKPQLLLGSAVRARQVPGRRSGQAPGPAFPVAFRVSVKRAAAPTV